jgi:hypothetical protein
MKKLLVVPVLIVALLGVGCSTAWVSTLDSILAAAAPAIINILEIVAVAKGVPVNAQEVAKINGDATALKSLASDYATASAAAAPGVCSQLNAAIGVFGQDITAVEAVAQVTDVNTQTKITLLFSLVSGTVQAITAVVPSCKAGVVANYKSVPPLSVKNFVADYNARLVAKTGNASVDALTPKLKLHQHSKLVRYASAGLLK